MHDPRIFSSVANHARVFTDLSSVQNQERKSQAAKFSAHLDDSWAHCPRSNATPYVLQFAKSQIRRPRTSDEDSHSWLLFILEYVGAPFAKAL